MKAQHKLITLALAITLLLVSTSTILAVPPMPSSFWGTVKVDGMNVPVDTTISAWIDGVECGETTVFLASGDTVYSMNVLADDPDTPEKDCGVADDTVIFHVDDQVADQTGSWQSGTSTHLDLTYTGESQVDIAKTPDAQTVLTGSDVNFTIAVTNTGNVRVDSVTITDTLVPACDANLGILTAGASTSYTCTVASVTADFTNTVAVTGTSWVGDLVSDTNTAQVDVIDPSIGIVKAPNQTVISGFTATFTITVENSGDVVLTGVIVTDAQVPTCDASFASLAAGESTSYTCALKDVRTGFTNSVMVAGTSPISSTVTATDTALVQVIPAADLAVTKTDSPDPVIAGTPLTYTVTITNNGPSDATGVILTDTLPGGVTFNSVISSQGTYDSGSGVWTVGTLAESDSATLTMLLTVNPSTTGALVNQVDASGNELDLDTSNNTDTEETVVDTAADLALTKIDDPDPVLADHTLAYTLTMVNNGPSDATGVTLTDTLPAEVTFDSASVGCTYSSLEHIITCNVGPLATTATAAITATVTVTSPLPNDTVLTNTATVESDQADLDDENNSAQVQTTVRSAPILSLIKSDGPDPVEAGAQLVYTLTYANTGNETATSIVITDVLNSHVTYFDADPPAQDTDHTPYWTFDSLASDERGEIRITVTVASPLPDGTVLTNTAWLNTDQTAPLSTTQNTTVQSRPVLTITKTSYPDPVNAGGILGYTLVITNSGNENASNIVITEQYDPNVSFFSSNPAPSSGDQVWTLPLLAIGNSESIDVFVQVTNTLPVGTVLTNHVTLDSDQTVQVTAVETTSVASASELAVYKLDSPDNGVQAGEELMYVINYQTSGTAPAEDVVITETYDSRMTFVSASETPRAGTNNVWDIGNLNVNEGGNIMVIVNVDTPLANGTILTNRVTIDSAYTSPKSFTETTSVSSAPDVTMSITDWPDPVAAGAPLTYTVRYTNTGNAGATQVVVTVTLDANVSYLTSSITPTGGADNVWYWVDEIPGEGGVGEIVIHTAVTLPLTNGTRLDFALQLEDAEGDFLGDTAQTMVSSAPDLHLQKSDGVATVYAGDLLTYTLTGTNDGNENAYNVTITDTLPDYIRYVDCNIQNGSCQRVPTGEDEIVFHISALVAQTSVQAQLVVQVNDPLPAGATFVVNRARMTTPSLPTPVDVQDVDRIGTLPDLIIDGTHGPSLFSPGKQMAYIVTYGNAGRMNAKDVIITTTLPTGTTYIGSGWHSSDGQTYTYPVGDLPAGDWSQPNRVYANNSGDLTLAWSSPETDTTTSIAWGDWDGDTDLDLAVGNLDQPNRVYANSGSNLTLAWSSPKTYNTESIAWGDWDGDAYLDLVTGNLGQANRVYSDDSSSLALAWSSPDTDNTTSVAWEDWDGDGDLDLAVGNLSQPNRVYANTGGNLTLVWSSPETDTTKSVAWGDWDGDGDLDLAVGNLDQPNRVYTNTGGSMTLAWSSPETDTTASVAWGDWDGDDDLDLAVGNLDQPNRVYTNTGGSMTLAWSSPETDTTASVAWGDWDGDDDLDLAVGNMGQPNRVYSNIGDDLTLAWSSPEMDNTASVAWGDWDGDTDLDLAVGNTHRTATFIVEHPGQSQISAPEFNTSFTITENSNAGGDGNPDDNTVPVYIGVPDLAVVAFTFEPSPLQPDVPVTFTIVLENQGSIAAYNPDNGAGFWVDVFVSPVSSYPYDRDGEFYKGVSSVGAGLQNTVTIVHQSGFSEQAIQDQILGFYAKVDNSYFYPYGLVPESNEMNNTMKATTPIRLPDHQIYLPLILR